MGIYADGLAVLY